MQHLEFFEFTLFVGFSFALVIIVYLLSFLLSFSKVYNSSAVFEKISPSQQKKKWRILPEGTENSARVLN